MSFATTLTPDAPIVLDASYGFNKSDRRYIDSQVITLQSMIQQLLASGVCAQWYTSNDTISVGNIVCTDINGFVVRAFATPLQTAGAALGFALLPSLPGQPVLIATGGLIGPGIHGLFAPGVAGAVAIVNTATAQAMNAGNSPIYSSSPYFLGPLSVIGPYITLNSLPQGLAPNYVGGATVTSFPYAVGQVLTMTSTTAAAWQAPTGGGATVTWANDLAGSTSTSQQVSALTKATAIPVTGPGFTSLSTASATGQNIGLTSGASTATNGTPGNVVAAIPLPTGTGGEGYLTVTRGGSTIVQIGACQGASSFDAIYFGGVTPGTTNYAFLGNATTTYLNGTGSVNFQVNGALQGSFTTNVFGLTAPTFAWGSGVAGPTITQSSTASASGTNLTFAAQASTTAGGTSANGVGGNLVFQSGAGSYASGNVQIFSGSLKMMESGWNAAFNTQGTTFNSTGVYGRALSIWNSGASSSVYTFGSTDGTNGYLFRDATASNATSPANVYTNAVTSQHFAVSLNDVLALTSSAVKVSQPIVGDSVASPYGVHGNVIIAPTGSRALTAAEYAQDIWIVEASTSGYTLTVPAPAAGLGYCKDVYVPAGYPTVTFSTGSGSTVLTTTAPFKSRLYITSTGIV